MADALRLHGGFNQYGMLAIGSPTNVSLSGSGIGLATIFQSYSADPITHLGYRYGARTGTPPTYIIGLESVDGSGHPDGTVLGGGSPASVTFTPPASAAIDGTWVWQALANSYTPTRGQFLAATIRYSSGTVDASNFSSFSRTLTGSVASLRGLPYASTLSGGTWTKQSAPPLFGYRTASGRYGIVGVSSYNTATANTSGHKSGMHFTLPSGFGTSFKVAGLSFVGDMGAAAGSCKVCIYDTANNLLQSVTVDGDHLGGNGAAGDTFSTVMFADSTLATLSYGTKYYAVIEVVSGAVGMTGLSLTEAADRSAFPNGTNRGLVTYNGSYTETDTVMPLCDLILDDVTVPSGGGGGPVIGGRLVL